MFLSLQSLLEHLLQLHTIIGKESATTIAVSLISSIIRHELLTETGKGVNLSLILHLVICCSDNLLSAMNECNYATRLDADFLKSKLAAISISFFVHDDATFFSEDDAAFFSRTAGVVS